MTAPQADEPEFRPATEADAPAMLEVLRAAFPDWPPVPISVTPEDHIRWKMESHPRAPHTNTVITVNDRVGGALMQVRREIFVRGNLMFAHTGADMAIHPDFQERGFMRKAQPYAERNVLNQFDFAFNTGSNHPRVRRRQAARGEVIAFGNPFRVYTQSFAARAFVASHLRTAGPRQLLAAGIRTVRSRLAGGASNGAPAFEVSTVTEFDDRASALWERATGQFEFIADRRAAFLNWRYLDPRAGKSVARAVFAGDRLLGYAVLTWTEPVAIVADLLVEPGREDVASALLADAVDQARDRSEAIRFALPLHHPYREAVESAGFLDDGRGSGLQYNPHGRGLQALEFLQQPEVPIHVTLGDFDYV